MAITSKCIGDVVQASVLHLLFKFTEQHVLFQWVVEQLFRFFNGLAQQLGKRFLSIRIIP